MTFTLNPLDRVEILTLQDNYIDLTSGDSNDMVHRAMPVKDGEIKNSLLAEHGFSSLITITRGTRTRTILFDFGFSPQGAAYNADTLDVDLSTVDISALSHGHMDHFGGMDALMKRVGDKKLDLVVHPEAFRKDRYHKVSEDLKVKLPILTREEVQKNGIHLKETVSPLPLLDHDALFLGEIPRVTDFEKGAPDLFYLKNGQETWDDLSDDTALAMRVKGKGLVVISGCAHAGIINTVAYAKKISGINEVFAVMGGFHLSGPTMKPAIEPTIQGLQECDPTFVIPTHCTGRDTTIRIENKMPERFVLNMVGTKLTFSA